MRNALKIGLVSLFMSLCFWLSKQHNDTYAAAPFSNIHTTIVGGGSSTLIISTFVGPSNTLSLNNSFWIWSAAGNVAITNVSGVDTNNNLATWATVIFSNSTASDIISYSTVPYARSIGAQTHNPLTIPSHKVAIWSYLTLGTYSTNFVNSVQDAVSSGSGGIAMVAAGTNIFIVTNGFLATISVADPFIVDTIEATNATVDFLYVGITNAVLLSSDGSGLLQQTDFSAATNNDTTLSNNLYTIIQSSTNSASINATNNDLAISNALWIINNLNSINSTNNDTVVSNGVVAHTIQIQGTAGQINSSVSSAQPLSGNPATVLSLADLSATYELHIPKLTNSIYGTNVDNASTTWLGASNTIFLNNGYQTYVASTAISITNWSATREWATLLASNSLATSITGYCTIPNIRFIGTQSTNALVIPAGKVGIWSFLGAAGMSNCVNNVQQ